MAGRVNEDERQLARDTDHREDPDCDEDPPQHQPGGTEPETTLVKL